MVLTAVAAAGGVAPAVSAAPSPAAGGGAAPRPLPAAPDLGISDGRVLASADPQLRAAGIGVAHAVGARIGRIPIGWSSVSTSEGFTRPTTAGVPLSEPSSPGYRWERIDAAVRDLAAAGLVPVAYFTAAPLWAQSAPRYVYAAHGTWAPRPADLADFASAVARRYDGSYPDPLYPGHPLPRIARFQTWNEPNLGRYLQPQWVGDGQRLVLFSARWYRQMHAAAYAAIHARQPDAQVSLAGLAPTGDVQSGGGRVPPLRFLRALLCVDHRDTGCGAPLPFDAIAIHPLSTTDPDRPASRVDDVAVADVQPKLARLLRRARRQGRLRSGVAPALWITELNWTSADVGGVLTGQQPAVLGRAILRLQQAGAAFVLWQFVTDPPLGRTGGSLRPAGLTIPRPGDARGIPGAPKAFLSALRFPVVAVVTNRQHAYVWGIVPRAARSLAAGHATVQRRVGTHWVPVGRVALDPDGTAHGIVEARAGSTLRLAAGRRHSSPVWARWRIGRVLASSPVAHRSAGTDAITSLDGPVVDQRAPEAGSPPAFPALRPTVPGGIPPGVGPASPLAVRRSWRLGFVGSSRGELLLGSSSADSISGAGGHDLIIGLGGDDRVRAGAGSAVVVRRP
ncbi:MAG: hypothetical protein QM679_02690 [Patulibacter sp.]